MRWRGGAGRGRPQKNEGNTKSSRATSTSEGDQAKLKPHAIMVPEQFPQLIMRFDRPVCIWCGNGLEVCGTIRTGGGYQNRYAWNA